jgi:uncharacterized repeat protein (TIGR03803 family)
VINRSYVLTFLVVFVLGALAQAQTFTILYSFTGGSDGGNPDAGVILDSDGNIYGTSAYGGDLTCQPGYGCGVVFKLNTVGRETVLHRFSGPDGELPRAPLVRDSKGNIYGTTYFGGSANCSYPCGIVFKIGTAGEETVLYSFTGGSDGCNPSQGLIRDKAGNLYGTTSSCGSSGYGTIFKVDNAGKFTLLHSFAGYPSDGGQPLSGHLTMDKSGNIYGVTSLGGSIDCQQDGYGCGMLYKLTKNRKLTVLYSFAGGATDGCNPLGSVVQDKAGNFYGTTSDCGSNNYGTIWKANMTGKEIIIHNFAGGSSDGCTPYDGVTRDSRGNLYGVATYCGANSDGALYRLSASGKFRLLHSFGGTDGAPPVGELWRTSNGTLFGSTWLGGTGNCFVESGCGTVWSYIP